MTQFNLIKKNVLITGAAHGIGASLAKQFAKEGCALFLVDCDESKLTETGNEIKAMEVDPILSVNNLALAEERKQVFQTTTEKGFHVDILVNNVSVGHWKYFNDTPEEKIQEMLNVNIHCTTHMTKLFLPDMLKKDSGQIVNLSSTAAMIGAPNGACYSATKSYIKAFGESLSMELANTGINVLTVSPGATETHFWEYAGMTGSGYEDQIEKMTSEEVALDTLSALKSGKSEVIIGLKNKFNMLVVKLAPRELLKKVALRRFE